MSEGEREREREREGARGQHLRIILIKSERVGEKEKSHRVRECDCSILGTQFPFGEKIT